MRLFVSSSCHPWLLQPKNSVTLLSEVSSLCLSLLGHVEGFLKSMTRSRYWVLMLNSADCSESLPLASVFSKPSVLCCCCTWK